MADILWRDDAGNLAIWLMDRDKIANSGIIAKVSTQWSVVRSGDFDGNGKADILWRDTAGNVAIWLMDANTVTQALYMGIVSDRMPQ